MSLKPIPQVLTLLLSNLCVCTTVKKLIGNGAVTRQTGNSNFIEAQYIKAALQETLSVSFHVLIWCKMDSCNQVQVFKPTSG